MSPGLGSTPNQKSLNPLSIVHTESSLGWGGQEIRVLSESQGLIRRGHEVRLICPPEARIHAEAGNWGVPVTALRAAWIERCPDHKPLRDRTA